jgi:hypothetical protein
MKILLLGSSIIKRWTNITLNLENEYIINKGISGLPVSSLSNYNKDLKKIKKPDIIIFYCGGYDILHNLDNKKNIYKNIIDFIENINNIYNKKVNIIILSILKNKKIEKINKIKEVNYVNNKLRNKVKDEKNIKYININFLLKNINDNFKEDMIHLTEIGYEKLNDTLKILINKNQ